MLIRQLKNNAMKSNKILFEKKSSAKSEITKQIRVRTIPIGPMTVLDEISIRAPQTAPIIIAVFCDSNNAIVIQHEIASVGREEKISGRRPGTPDNT